MNSREALTAIETDVKNIDKIKNFLISYDKQLLTAERFVYLVKSILKEEVGGV